MARCRMVCGNTQGALCQSQLQHSWTPAWSFSWFSQSCQAKIGHDHFPAYIFKSLFCNHHSWHSAVRKINQFCTHARAHMSQIFQPLNNTQCSHFLPISDFKTNQDGHVSAVCYSLGNQGIVVHIPLGARNLFLVQSIQTSSGIPTTFISQEHQECCAHWIKQTQHAADQSPPSTAKVDNEWSYTSTLLTSVSVFIPQHQHLQY